MEAAASTVKSCTAWACTRIHQTKPIVKCVSVHAKQDTHITKLSCFEMRSKLGILVSNNDHLISCYKELKENPVKLYKGVKELIDNHNEDYYYDLRDEFNKSHRPDLFLYLNRTCYNGIYRENKSGGFNVPVGRRIRRTKMGCGSPHA